MGSQLSSSEGRPSHTAHGNQRLPKTSPKSLSTTHSLVLEVTSVLLAARSLNCLLLCCLPVDPSNEKEKQKNKNQKGNQGQKQKQKQSLSWQQRLQHANAINTPADRAEMELGCWPMARANGHRAYASYGHFKLALLHFA